MNQIPAELAAIDEYFSDFGFQNQEDTILHTNLKKFLANLKLDPKVQALDEILRITVGYTTWAAPQTRRFIRAIRNVAKKGLKDESNTANGRRTRRTKSS